MTCCKFSGDPLDLLEEQLLDIEAAVNMILDTANSPLAVLSTRHGLSVKHLGSKVASKHPGITFKPQRGNPSMSDVYAGDTKLASVSLWKAPEDTAAVLAAALLKGY